MPSVPVRGDHHVDRLVGGPAASSSSAGASSAEAPSTTVTVAQPPSSSGRPRGRGRARRAGRAAAPWGRPSGARRRRRAAGRRAVTLTAPPTPCRAAPAARCRSRARAGRPATSRASAARRTAAGSRTTSSRPAGKVSRAVVVAADADVLEPGHLPDVLDVVGDARRPSACGGARCSRSRITGSTLLEAARVTAALAHARRGSSKNQSACPWSTNGGTKVTMHTPPLPASAAEHVVGDVARVVADGARRAVAEDHGRGRHVERVAHHVGGDVREVDEHADPVHLADHVAAEVGEPAEHRLVGGGVGPGHVLVVGQRHVAHAERVHHPQRAERGVDRVAALHADQRRDPAAGAWRRRPRSAVRHSARSSGNAVDEAVHEVDLLERRGDRLVAGERAGHEHRPELAGDAAGRAAAAGRCARRGSPPARSTCVRS